MRAWRRARDLAALLQFDPREQIGLSEAVWQVAGLAEGRGRVEFAVVNGAQSLEALTVTVSGVSGFAHRVADDAPRVDLDVLRRLVERVDVRDVDGVVVVHLMLSAGPDAWNLSVEQLQMVLDSLARHDIDCPGRIDLPPLGAAGY